VGILDSAVRNAQLVQARGPPLQLVAVTAGEGHMIQAGAMLVESVTGGMGWVCQPNNCPPSSANTVW
jgi:hypothetical protein